MFFSIAWQEVSNDRRIWMSQCTPCWFTTGPVPRLLICIYIYIYMGKVSVWSSGHMFLGHQHDDKSTQRRRRAWDSHLPSSEHIKEISLFKIKQRSAYQLSLHQVTSVVSTHFLAALGGLSCSDSCVQIVNRIWFRYSSYNRPAAEFVAVVEQFSMVRCAHVVNAIYYITNWHAGDRRQCRTHTPILLGVECELYIALREIPTSWRHTDLSILECITNVSKSETVFPTGSVV